MLIDAPPTLLNTVKYKKHLSHFMAKTINELAHKSPLIFVKKVIYNRHIATAIIWKTNIEYRRF